MRKLKLFISTLFLFIFSGLRSFAQDSVNASGKDASGAGGTVNYSVGQLVYTVPAGAAGSMAQGVQQPYEISIVTGIKNASGILLSFSAYPNPTIDFLNLSIGNYNIENLFYQLYDVEHKLIEDRKITTEREVISMKAFASGMYFLTVRENNHELKTFKIIKN